jgi:hypothetical protein
VNVLCKDLAVLNLTVLHCVVKDLAVLNLNVIPSRVPRNQNLVFIVLILHFPIDHNPLRAL